MNQPIKNLTGLAIAVQVAERGSFAEASRALGLSTSAVSKSINRLENQLGIKLFNRTTRSVSLTSDGGAYIDKVNPLLTQIYELTNDLTDNPQSPSGLLRVSATIPFGRIVLAPIVAKFTKQFPSIQFELVLDDKILDLTGEQIDVSIRTGSMERSPNVVARRLLSDPLTLCASPEYLSQYGEPQTIEELSGHRRVTFKNSDTGRIEPWKFASSPSISAPGSVQSNTMDSMAEIVLEGGGLGQISRYQVAHAIETGQLKEVLKSQRPPELVFSVIYQSRHLLAPRIRVFIDFLVEELSA